MAAPAPISSRLADYDLRYIDKGAFGSVFKAVRRADGREFALKQVDLSLITKRVELAMAIDEARMLAQLNHPHVIRYYDSFIDAENRLNILMEYASKGSLKGLLKLYKGKTMPEDGVWRIAIQALLGLHYLHSKKIIHRDIKSANLFIDANDNIKIGDLGIARTLSASSNLAHTQLGTPYYLAPEVCEDKPYNTKSDIWALGIVLYECCMGCYPFDVDNNNTAALIRKIIRGQFKPVQGPYSAALVQLVNACLTFKAETRPDTSLLLRGPALVAKAKVLNVDLNPRPAPDAFEGPRAGPSPGGHGPPAAGPSGQGPYYNNAGSPGQGAGFGSYQQQQLQQPQYPYQQGQAQYSPQQRPVGGRPPQGGAGGHPFALAGQAGAGPPNAFSPQQQQQQQPYNAAAGVAYPRHSPREAPYAVQAQGPYNAWEELAADVNNMQLREGEAARFNAERQQQAQANMHAGRQDQAKNVIYGGAQDSGPKVQRAALEVLPAAGRRPTQPQGQAPFATHYAGGADLQTVAHANMNEAWNAAYQPPQYGRRRNPELQITGPSLRSGGGTRGNTSRGGGYVPAADDATTYVSSTYYTSNR